ncbi:MAG: hypothetical protein ACRELA_07475 [Candidatus Rokuibacteriota bacterium]
MLGCTNVANVPESPYGPINPAYGGPEYESVSGLGSQLGIADPGWRPDGVPSREKLLSLGLDQAALALSASSGGAGRAGP